ncbi:hypothetical protein TTRE_0000510301 [Trichuris trichiura]|uniref:Uncharacterized protein n=1 Tax=Trichuris trichiura TaxID=36087 RepID=A0A077Z9C6_TRITR|nr:hypothetical protein TTRE_0000510301 [Trichuris trichiura]
MKISRVISQVYSAVPVSTEVEDGPGRQSIELRRNGLAKPMLPLYLLYDILEIEDPKLGDVVVEVWSCGAVVLKAALEASCHRDISVAMISQQRCAIISGSLDNGFQAERYEDEE